ncbi:MAG: tRNA (adenosine(37)-N6)-dimethylallyltransferase MiaA [Acidimicrobiia bacterium]|nr:tRNA (adenosine(37)-N6)-dimethylallyltransferase MiaA [Acidimicrobiia bacterium]
MTRLWAVLGPTASGKTCTAIELAERIDAEIISVDSMQVYRGMDIGTAKATTEEQARVRHHMIDVVEPEETFDVVQFREMGRAVIDTGRPMVIVGGSGLHFRSLVDPMSFAPSDPAVREELGGLPLEEVVAELLSIDSESGTHVDLSNPRRVVRALEIAHLGGGTPTERAISPEAIQLREYIPQIPFRAVGLDPGDRIADRIGIRTQRMSADGLLAEVARLAPRLGPTARTAVGYRQLLEVVTGEISEDAGFDAVESVTRHLVRRQRTFFRRDPRIQWLPWDDDPRRMVGAALAHLQNGDR